MFCEVVCRARTGRCGGGGGARGNTGLRSFLRSYLYVKEINNFIAAVVHAYNGYARVSPRGGHYAMLDVR